MSAALVPAATEGTRTISENGKKPPVARRVLIVDDEPLIRWMLAETFGDCGIESVQAGSAAQAVEASMKAPFDAVLLDLRLPDSNDLALLVRLQDAQPEARFILMTAFDTPALSARALELGVYRVVSKPFEAIDLRALVMASA